MLAVEAKLSQIVTNKGENLKELSANNPILLVFLRHFGCQFCKEAMADIALKREELEAMGTRIVFVHMSSELTASHYLKEYGLEDLSHVSDPDCQYYTRFGLKKGTFNQLFGLRVWMRTYEAGIKNRHGLGIKQIGDGFQMPGVFLIHQGEVKERFIHKYASDRPDYLSIAACCVI